MDGEEGDMKEDGRLSEQEKIDLAFSQYIWHKLDEAEEKAAAEFVKNCTIVWVVATVILGIALIVCRLLGIEWWAER